jgi:hypothetical protein
MALQESHTQISFGTHIFQVTWMPYTSPEIMALQESHGLNVMCL